MEILHHLMRMLALPVRMHDDDTSLPDKSLQSTLDLDRRERGVGIAGHDIPQNEPEAACAGHIDRVVVELSVGRTKQVRNMLVLGFEQANRSEHFLLLLLRRMERHMRVDVPMGADFKEWDLEKGFYLPIMLRHPFPRHEEGGRDFPLNQIVDQGSIVACAIPHRAKIECERHAVTGKRARRNHLGLRSRRHRWDKQHCENKAQHVWEVTRHGGKYT